MITSNKYVKWAMFPFVVVIAILEALWNGVLATVDSLKQSYHHIKDIYTE